MRPGLDPESSQAGREDVTGVSADGDNGSVWSTGCAWPSLVPARALLTCITLNSLINSLS